MLGRILGGFARDVAIDLGTANTLIYLQGRGIVCREPSVVAVDRREGRVLAVGAEAKAMIGRTPEGVEAVRPMRDGVIADFDITAEMLRRFLARANVGRGWVKPRVVICVPFGVTSVEKRAVRESARAAGAREVFLIEEPMAAALGAGVDAEDPAGSMVVDIGGGTTEVAVVSLGGIVLSESIRVAGDRMDDEIRSYVRRRHNVLIGERTAEAIKVELGEVTDGGAERRLEVKGRDLVEGSPTTLTVTSTEVRRVLADLVEQIVEAVHRSLERTPPELASDVGDRGILLTGGGALIRGMAERLTADTGIATRVIDDPLSAVAIGSGRVLEDRALLERVTMPG